MSEQQRVMYFVGTKKDGSFYPGRVTLYPLEMESVEDGMDVEQRKQVYRENCRRASEKFRSFDAYKNHVACNTTGCNGHITTKDGQPKKIVDMVTAFLAEKGKDSIYNKPIGLFYFIRS